LSYSQTAVDELLLRLKLVSAAGKWVEAAAGFASTW
jgi:hypothetical protein